MPPPFRVPYASVSNFNQFVIQFNSMQQKKKPQTTARHKFTPEEDQKLKQLVAELGENEWSEVANRLGTRSPRQCRERFRNYLAPNLKNDPWTEEEDRLLIEKHKEFGTKWSVIAAYFPDRSDVNIKNHWTQMMNRTMREHDIRREKQQLVKDLESVIAGSRNKQMISPLGLDGPLGDTFSAMEWEQEDPGILDFFDGLGF